MRASTFAAGRLVVTFGGLLWLLIGPVPFWEFLLVVALLIISVYSVAQIVAEVVVGRWREEAPGDADEPSGGGSTHAFGFQLWDVDGSGAYDDGHEPPTGPVAGGREIRP